jgi:hypothetical protein
MKRPKNTPSKSSWAVNGNIDINILLCFGFGIIFLSIMLIFATQYPNPTPFQIRVFMTALSLAAAGIGALLPGYLEVTYKNLLRADPRSSDSH